MISKLKAIFVLGGPGSGKGTQCNLIAKKYKFKHLSAGQLLRLQQKNLKSQYSQIIQQTINTGKIVPSHITISLLHNQMLKNKQFTTNFLIDGFPRSLQNLSKWNQLTSQTIQVPFILNLICTQQQMLKRLLKRKQQSDRSDDQIQIIRKRFVTHRDITGKVIEQFKKNGKVIQVMADGRVQDIFQKIEKIFDQQTKNKNYY